MRTIFFIFLFSFAWLGNIFAETVCVKDVCIEAEVADSPESRQLGLMFRESMPENRGMLFVFPQEGKYNFWMKNMNFPLDMIWVDSNYTIVEIKENMLPCRDSCPVIAPSKEASFVLEVAVGFVKKNKLEVSDKIVIKK